MTPPILMIHPTGYYMWTPRSHDIPYKLLYVDTPDPHDTPYRLLYVDTTNPHDTPYRLPCVDTTDPHDTPYRLLCVDTTEFMFMIYPTKAAVGRNNRSDPHDIPCWA